MSQNLRKRAKELAEKQRKEMYIKPSTLILPKSSFEFKKGISDKTRITTHDYTGMLY